MRIRFFCLLAVLLGGVVGCGLNPDLSDEAQIKDANVKLAWLDRAITLAESHGLAYRVEVESTGRPSIGESVDLYFDTGLGAKVLMFGNAAAGRLPKEEN